MRAFYSAAILPIALAWCPAAAFGQANDQIKIELAQVVETRVSDPGAPEPNAAPIATTQTIETGPEELTQHMMQGAGLELSLRLSGPAVKSALLFGNITVKSATTNDGKALKAIPRYEVIPTDRAIYFAEGADDQTPEELRAYVLAEPSPRSATSIKSLEGSIDFYSGQPAKAEFPKAASLKGALNDAGLKNAKLGLKRVEPPQELAEQFPNALFLAIEGDPKKILNIHLAQRDAQPYIDFQVAEVEGKPVGIVFGSGEPLTDELTLRVVYSNDLKKTTVPFKLDNVQLP